MSESEDSDFYPTLNLYQIFAERARAGPDRRCLAWEPGNGTGRAWSYGEALAEINAHAAMLKDLGAGVGTRVMIHADNTPEHVFLWLACARLGAIAVMGNMNADERLFAHYLDLVRPEVIIAEQPKWCELARHGARSLLLCADLDEVRSRVQSAGLRDSTVPDHSPAIAHTIIFTSGTTGIPKGVVWTQANAVFAGAVNAAQMHIGSDEICLCHMPLYHTVGLSFLVATSIAGGAGLVLQPRFTPDYFWDISMRHACTWTAMPPQAVYALKHTAPAPREHAYRFWLLGAGGDEQVEKAHGIDTIGAWGMSETVAPAIAGRRGQVNPYPSVGIAAHQYELRTVLDNGDMARAGEVGSLQVRGRRGVELFQEYYGDEDATAAAFDPDGWFDTGDRVRSDERGWMYFTGRSKDLIKVGGENVIPAEIEQALAQHGCVRECAVVGASDPAFGEVPVAFVVPVAHEGAGVVESIITETNPLLAPVKRVRRVVLVRDLPRSTIGKVAKNLLRQWLEEPDLVPLDCIDEDARECGDITAVDKAGILEDLREIWAAAFNVGLDRVGADMDFFELGGDSLMGLEVLTRIGAHFGLKLEPDVLYEYSTPGGLAGYLEVLMLTRTLKGSDSGGDSPFVDF